MPTLNVACCTAAGVCSAVLSAGPPLDHIHARTHARTRTPRTHARTHGTHARTRARAHTHTHTHTHTRTPGNPSPASLWTCKYRVWDLEQCHSSHLQLTTINSLSSNFHLQLTTINSLSNFHLQLTTINSLSNLKKKKKKKSRIS